ncbi:hypothetical protein C8R48DRAFT_779993 [Suillus tomentosus]|nr:hypothetical protein C8R48DRAFT_779993 [Suillus tomentosus]
MASTKGHSPGGYFTCAAIKGNFLPGCRRVLETIKVEINITEKAYTVAVLKIGVLSKKIERPSTISEDGVEILREPGTVQVTNYPPVISIAVNDSAPGRLKDTATNLKNGQGFTVSIISEAFVENANATAIDAPRDFDEWTLSSLTKDKCVEIKASRVNSYAPVMPLHYVQYDTVF